MPPPTPIRYNVELINMLIEKERPKNFRTSGELLAWERGFLTGLLARLADEDSFVKGQIARRLKKEKR